MKWDTMSKRVFFDYVNPISFYYFGQFKIFLSIETCSIFALTWHVFLSIPVHEHLCSLSAKYKWNDFEMIFSKVNKIIPEVNLF